ncbi:MAG: glutaredoxin family protein [Cyclobacteriaceae bacterium]
MKKIKIFSFALLLMIGLQQCMIDGKSEQADSEQAVAQKEIIVYGSDECNHCVDFKKKLDDAGLEYTFYDVEKDQSKVNDMLMVVQRAGIRGNINYPVVVVDGDVQISPTFEQFQKAM